MRTLLPVLVGVAIAAPITVRAQGVDSPPAGARVVDSLRVRVRQVAGPDVYLDVGTGSGVAPGDTLPAAGEAGGAPLGRLRVLAGTEERSVLTFVGPPFPVVGGQTLILRLPRPVPSSSPGASRSAASAESAPPAEPAPESRPRRAERLEELPRHPLHGRMTMEVGALRSTTRFGDVDPTTVSRSFATPAFGASLFQDDLVGGFRFRTTFRVEYRYSGTDPIQPTTSTRIYTASLDRQWSSIPLRMELGRFDSPVEDYSGFWDGLFLRYGGRSFGGGALLGLQPNRWDQSPSVQRPKATAFLDGAVRGTTWSWSGDLSAHVVRGGPSLPDHRFIGASQILTSDWFTVAEDLQVDQDPATGRTTISNLRIRGSLALGASVRAHVGASRRRPYLDWSPTPLVGERRDQLVAGLSYRGSATSLEADLSRTGAPSGAASLGYTGFLDQDLGSRLRGQLQGSLWRSGSSSTLTVSPGLSTRWDGADLAVAYRFYRSDFLDRRIDTHSGEMRIHVTFGAGISAMAQLRKRWSRTLGSQEIRLSVVRAF